MNSQDLFYFEGCDSLSVMCGRARVHTRISTLDTVPSLLPVSFTVSKERVMFRLLINDREQMQCREWVSEYYDLAG